LRNLLAKVPKTAQSRVATLVRTIFTRTPPSSRAPSTRVVERLAQRWPCAAQLLENAVKDLLALTAFPKEHWREIWSNNPQERLNRKLRRRTDVVRIFPNRDAVVPSSALARRGARSPEASVRRMAAGSREVTVG
jgi:putative transposase